MEKKNRPRDDGPRPAAKVSRLTDEEHKEKETTPSAKESLYFSNLTEDQLMALFRESPLLRFQICSVHVKCKRSGTRNKLYGFIRVVGSDLESRYVFIRDFDESVIIHANSMLLPGICCSVPARNNAVEIHAKLFLTTDKDYKLCITGYDVEDIIKSDDEECRELFDDDFNEDNYFSCFRRRIGYPEKEIDIKDNEPFEYCDVSLSIDLSDGAIFSPSIIQGKGGSALLHYVALKYAVDATVELDFVADNEEVKLDASVVAYYGNNFDYGPSHCAKSRHKVCLVYTKPKIDIDDILMPGKINLSVSTLAVPVQFPLVITASFMDVTSLDIMLKGSHEFHVPRDGSTSFGIIKGIGCYLKLKVDWKLPPLDMPSL